MEILIRLAGIQLGPYSEEQVRKHLSDGLLSLSDTARVEGVTDWAPLVDVMAGTAPPPAEAPPEPAPPVEENESFLQLPPQGQAPSDLDETARKTIVLGPSAPRRPAGRGPTSTSIATTTPLIPQNTKKMSRAMMVKQLASQTSPLPTKAINVIPRPRIVTPIPTPEPQTESKRAASPTLEDSLTAKTVPLHEKSAAPPLPATPSSTAPLPTRHIFKPAPETAPSAAPAQADPPPLPPARAGSPPSPHELEVAADLIPAPVYPPPSASRRVEPPSLPSPAVTASTRVLEILPIHLRRRLPWIIGAWALLAALAIYYVWSPYHAAASLLKAIAAGDAARLSAAIDFPSVRASLKAQINEQIAQSGPSPKPNSPPNPSANVALSMLGNSIDGYMTPEAMAGLVRQPGLPAAGQTALISPDTAAKILLAFNTAPTDSQGLSSFNDFVIYRGGTLLHLRFTGLGWKLKRVQLSGSAAPLLSPVLDTYLARGEAKVKSGDSKGAIADFSQVLSLDPESSAAYSARAAVLAATGDPDGAFKDFTAALAVNPQMATAYNGRGNTRLAKNDPDGAIADFTQAVHFDPTLATAFDSRGIAKVVKGDADGAIADFTQAITIDPAFATAYNDRGVARQANGNSDGAIADFSQALALKPKVARVYFNRGVALQAQGNIDAAVRDFNRALLYDPSIADAYYFRGNSKSSNQDLDGAIADYTDAIGLDPKNAAAYSHRGLARQAKEDYDGAVADFTQALALDPKIVSAYYNRAIIEAQRNDSDDAIADSSQVLYLDPKNAQAYCTRGFAKLTKGNLEGALADLKQFCDLAPRDHETDHARLYLWLIGKAQNSGADGDQDLTTALENSWNSAPDQVVTKTANYFLGRMNEPDYLASATSPDAKTDQVQHCLVWYFTGMKRTLMGDKKGAIDAFTQCVATGEKDLVESVLAQAELQALQPVLPPPVPAIAPSLPKAPPVAKGPKTD